jgi:hypothetical protein
MGKLLDILEPIFTHVLTKIGVSVVSSWSSISSLELSSTEKHATGYHYFAFHNWREFGKFSNVLRKDHFEASIIVDKPQVLHQPH